MRRSGSVGLWLGVAVLSLPGCHPTCKKVCKTLLACEEVETARINQDECEESCLQQESLYKDRWEDTILLDAFYAQNECIVDSTCAEVADGKCYDASLYSYKDTGSVTETGE